MRNEARMGHATIAQGKAHTCNTCYPSSGWISVPLFDLLALSIEKGHLMLVWLLAKV